MKILNLTGPKIRGAHNPTARAVAWSGMDSRTQQQFSAQTALKQLFLGFNNAQVEAERQAIDWNRFSVDRVFPSNASVRAAASNEDIAHHTNNYTILRHNDPGGTDDLSATEVLVHESGHNLARENVHSRTGYGYTDRGLSSNQPRNVYPTQSNTMSILNDQSNRNNSSTIRFDNSKLR